MNQPVHACCCGAVPVVNVVIAEAVVDGKILAREEISPFRKDVLAKMSGGDRGRKDKLLDKQKKGKEKLVKYSRIDLPQEALLALIKRD